MASKLTKKDQILLKEYELSQTMARNRGDNIWVSGSVLMGGGVAALALLISRVTPPNFFASATCFVIAFFQYIYYTKVTRSRVIAEIHWRRCREIEQILGMKQHTYVRKASEKDGVIINDTTVPGETDSINKINDILGWHSTIITAVIIAALAIFMTIVYFPKG